MKTNQLVEARNGSSVTTSLQIAKVFGKDHSRILKDIRALECSRKFISGNFALYHYHSKLNENVTRKLPMYYITRDGFTFLAMGFTGKVAAKFKEDYINAFNTMNKQLLEIQQKGLVSASCLQIEQQQTTFWKEQSDFWRNLSSRSTKIMGAMSKNELRLAELMVEYREENRVLLKEKAQAPTIRPERFRKLTGEYYARAVKSFAEWLNWENTGCYDPTIRDEYLVKRLEATRLLYHDPSRKVVPSNVATSKESEVCNA